MSLKTATVTLEVVTTFRDIFTNYHKTKNYQACIRSIHTTKNLRERFIKTLVVSNDALTRYEIQLLLTNMFKTYFDDALIFDYIAVCDETNNRPTVVDSNEFTAELYVKLADDLNLKIITIPFMNKDTETHQVFSDLS